MSFSQPLPLQLSLQTLRLLLDDRLQILKAAHQFKSGDGFPCLDEIVAEVKDSSFPKDVTIDRRIYSLQLHYLAAVSKSTLHLGIPLKVKEHHVFRFPESFNNLFAL